MPQAKTYSLSGRPVVWGGIIGGALAGLCMALLVCVQSYLVEKSFWLPLKLIGATYFDTNYLISGPSTGVVLGLLTHLAVAALAGIVFAYIVQSLDSFGSVFFAGILYGISVWLFMTYLVLPFVNPAMQAFVNASQGGWFLAHMVFGGLLALTPYFEGVAAYGAENHHFIPGNPSHR
jgi:hypothetical protein